jgi:predicted ABC-type ATPase
MLGVVVPKVVVIAGPNGAGKSTAAPAVLRNALLVNEFVNADTIAAGLSAFSPETVAVTAGRVMLERIRKLACERRDFAFETTLASRTFAPWLRKIQSEGYQFHLVYLWLPTVELAAARVAERVRRGGHAVQEAIRDHKRAGNPIAEWRDGRVVLVPPEQIED